MSYDSVYSVYSVVGIPVSSFSRVEGLRVVDGTVGCLPKRASRREERGKPARNLQVQTALEAL